MTSKATKQHRPSGALESVYLSVGGNRGDREGLLARACGMIRERIGDLARVSSLYESEPWGFEDPTSFCNLAAEVKTALSPEGVLRKIHEIEDSLGRIRALQADRRASDGERIYEPRAMDIDILFYGSKMIRTKDLAIPHPRLPERKFILVPLAEIAPDLIHPALNKTIGELLAACRDTGKVKRRWNMECGGRTPLGIVPKAFGTIIKRPDEYRGANIN